MDSTDHGRVVLSAILAGRRKDLLNAALRNLQPDHFPDPTQRGLFIMAERFLDVAGEVLAAPALADMLRGATAAPGTALAYEETYAALAASEPTEAEFRWSLMQLREIAAEQTTGEALAQGMEILRKGAVVGKDKLQGHKDCRAWMISRLAEIDRELNQADTPEGDMRTEAREVAAEYVQRRRQGTQAFVPTSIPELDAMLGGGLDRGSLTLVAGYAHAGKTSLICQLAHSACVQGKNVVFFTSETLRSQVRIKIIARHSRLERFALGEGLNSSDIKAGRLRDARVLGLVLGDWESNPDYGRLHVAQLPSGATMPWVDARLRRMASVWAADLVIIDYLQLLRADVRRQTAREEHAQIIKDASLAAPTYLDGRGVALVSPWQMSREARDKARGGNGYTLTGLAETNEASASPDNIISLLEPDDWRGGRKVTLRLQLLKSRDSEHGQEIPVDADYATSYFTARTGSSHESLLAEETL